MALDRLDALKVERGMLLALVDAAPRGRPEIAKRLARITARILRAELAARPTSIEPEQSRSVPSGPYGGRPPYWIEQ